MKSVLFVCTGNYYRSRTAEEVFNHYAQVHGVTSLAESAGLAEDFDALGLVGCISPFAVEFLAQKDIPIASINRMPQAFDLVKAQTFHHIICLDELEHRPMIEHRFPTLINDIEYWTVQDVPLEQPGTALPRIYERVKAMLLA